MSAASLASAAVPAPAPSTDPVLFEAVVVPHRSLSLHGQRVLAGSLLGLSGVIGAGLWFLGAWPVLGFNGLEVGLAVWLLRRNANATASEVITLSEAGLRIARTDARGTRTEQSVPAGWLQVVLEERPGRTPLLVLAQHGVRTEVGAALGEHEKRDLAAALRAALHRWRTPIFDNPQLRD